MAPRTPITAKLVADLLEAAGATRVVSMDMHAGQIQGFFNIPSDHLYALAGVPRGHAQAASPSRSDAGHRLARTPAAWSARAPTPSGSTRALAIIDKRRPRPNASEVMNLIGDVKGKDAVLIDDMVDTARHAHPGGRGAEGARARAGWSPTRCTPCSPAPPSSASHDSVLEEVVFTDTVPLSPAAAGVPEDPRRSAPSALFGEAIARIHRADSLSSLFV